MNIHTKAVHAGDRKKAPAQIGVTTPIYTAASFIPTSLEEQDRIYGAEEQGYAYQRYLNPTNAALEEQMTELEGGHGCLATASGMSALLIALHAALLDRTHSVICSRDIYGATIKLLDGVFEPFNVTVRYLDLTDLNALDAAIAAEKPGAVLLETISNPLLRVVADLEAISQRCRAVNAAFIVDNTFATPLLVRPWNWARTLSFTA